MVHFWTQTRLFQPVRRKEYCWRVLLSRESSQPSNDRLASAAARILSRLAWMVSPEAKAPQNRRRGNVIIEFIYQGGLRRPFAGRTRCPRGALTHEYHEQDEKVSHHPRRTFVRRSQVTLISAVPLNNELVGQKVGPDSIRF